MTHGNLKYELELRLRRGEISVTMDTRTADEMLNKTYQYLYPVALKNFPWFYTKSVALGGATADYSCPTDFKEDICIVDATADGGMKRRLTHREFETIQSNTRLAGTTASPVYVMSFSGSVAHITIAPSSDGTLWYYWRFGFGTTVGEITSNSYEITDFGGANAPILPSVMEELIIMQAQVFSNQRHTLMPDVDPDAMKKQMNEVQSAYTDLLTKMEASIQFSQETQPLG